MKNVRLTESGMIGDISKMEHDPEVMEALVTLVNEGFTPKEVEAMTPEARAKLEELIRGKKISSPWSEPPALPFGAAISIDHAKGDDWTALYGGAAAGGKQLPRRPVIGDTIAVGGILYRVRKLTNKDVVLREVK